MTTALVTGASGRLGRAISSALAARGVNLVLVGRDKERLLSFSADLPRGTSVFPLTVDLSSRHEIAALAKHAIQFTGSIDILVNNAAIVGQIGPLWDTSVAEFESVLAVDFMAPLLLTKHLLPSMIERKSGAIINISGGGATSSRPMFSAYASAKTALVRMTEILAAETKPFGVTVNAIAPGAFYSPMTEAVLSSGCAPKSEIDLANKLASDTGTSTPEKTAELICYLTCGDGREISGRLISAVWDEWHSLHRQQLAPDDFTLRRVLPQVGQPLNR